MYLRGRDYCLRSLELGYPGITARLSRDPDKAIAVLQKEGRAADVLERCFVGEGRGAQPGSGPALAGDFPIVGCGGFRRHNDRARRAGGAQDRDDRPDNSIYVKALREMAAAWKQRTGGRVTAQVYPGGDQTEEGMLRNMRPNFRKLHAAQLSAITLGTVDPAFNIFGLPMFYESYAEAGVRRRGCCRRS